MKNLIKLYVFFICLIFSTSSLSSELYDNDQIIEDESIISKYIDDYMVENNDRDDNSTELFEKKYELEFYPYLSIEYTSHELHDIPKDINK